MSEELEAKYVMQDILNLLLKKIQISLLNSC